MDRTEFLRMKIENFPDDVITQYKLKDIVEAKGFVIIRVEKGMYGLPYACIIEQNLLEETSETHGYTQSDQTPGFWTHAIRPISFTLIVDDFGVKYVGKEHVNHLIRVLEEFYEAEKDWKGKRYFGITLDWDYDQQKVHLLVPGYCSEALIKFRRLTSMQYLCTEQRYSMRRTLTQVQSSAQKANCSQNK